MSRHPAPVCLALPPIPDRSLGATTCLPHKPASLLLACWALNLQVDVKLLVNDVLDISAMLVRKNVKLIHSAGVVPIIIGDTGRIVQILYNLVGNAGGWRCHATSVFYSPRGTTGSKMASAQTEKIFLALALKGAHGS